MKPASRLPADLRRLLEATVHRFVSPAARVVGVDSSTLSGGTSGAKVQRHLVTLNHPEGIASTVRIVSKESTLVERRVLALLNTQGHACVPYVHTLASEEEGVALLCMEDLGDEARPNSRAPLDETIFESEAAGLSAVHAENLGLAEPLAWLPRADRSYYRRMIEDLFFRPAWERALADDFLAEFGDRVPGVEAAAARTVDEMAALFEEGDALTLVHTDLNPSNVLVQEGHARLVDWGTAHYGPFYLDVPHHFFTLGLAERYRKALERRGVEVAPGAFEERWRAAARYTALRYMWWTFEAWREDRAMAGWVWHYLDRLES